MSFDSDVLVNVASSAAAVQAQSFGLILLMSEGATFATRVQRYSTPAEIDADTLLTAALKTKAKILFSQNVHPSQIAIGKKAADAAQIITWTFSGTIVIGTKLKIVCNGISTEITSGGVVLNTEVDLLRAALVAALAAEDVTVGGVAPDITITADNAGEPFTYSSLVTVVGAETCAVAEVVTLANCNYATELALAQAENDDWYGLVIDSRAKADILYTAEWNESQKKLFVAQTNDSAVLSATALNVLATLNSLSYARTMLCWHTSNTEALDLAWAAYKLAKNPDDGPCGWSKTTLSGVTKNTTMTATQQSNLESQYGNAYLTMGGVGCTGPGKLVDGKFTDTIISKDWYSARTLEGAQQLFLDNGSLNRSVPLDNIGISQLVGVLESVQTLGESNGHFLAGSNTTSPPDISQVSDADKLARKITIPSTITLRGTVEKVVYNLSVLNV